MTHSSFHERVAVLCGRAAKALEDMAEGWREVGDDAQARLASEIGGLLRQLSFDALMDTQPIDRSLRDDEPSED